MIIQIRGTSGSGKSTVMRRVKDEIGGMWQPFYREGRKQPLYYGNLMNARLLILGHYESPCGGCDTIGSARQVFELTTELLEREPGRIILQEGLLLSEDTKWSSQMPDLRVLFLTTPLETCLKQIEGRRRAARNEKPLNPANTSNRVAVIERARVKLDESGVFCQRCPSEQAPSIVLRWIRQAAR